MLIDTHTHLFLSEFDHDRDEALQRAVKAGVLKCFLPNVDVSTILPMLNLADQYPDHCYPMMGLHPTSVRKNYADELRIIRDWLLKRKFYAIGETGLDLYRDKSFLKEQQKAFIFQIRLARENNLPVVIHARESFNEIFDIMDEEYDPGLTGIFHSFTGTLGQAEKIISYGFKIGIGGIVTFKNSGLGRLVEQIDPHHIVLETDSPYLAPVPKRGKRNEPSYLVHIAAKIAELHRMPVDEINRITTRNALDLFRIKPPAQ
jgi:TatD DNase family protein